MGALDLDWRAGRILPAACLVGLRRSLAWACPPEEELHITLEAVGKLAIRPSPAEVT